VVITHSNTMVKSMEKTSSKPSKKLSFDPKASADENIEAFLSLMEEESPEFGGLLRSNLEKILPLGEPGQRTRARVTFNKAVAEHLDK
jgi:hypothetical protein